MKMANTKLYFIASIMFIIDFVIPLTNQQREIELANFFKTVGDK